MPNPMLATNFKETAVDAKEKLSKALEQNDQDIADFAQAIERKLIDIRLKKGGDYHAEDRIRQMLIHRLTKEGWTKRPRCFCNVPPM